MNLHAVKVGKLRVFSALAKGFHDAGDLRQLQRTRCDKGLLRTHQAHMPGGCDGAGSHGQCAIKEHGVRDAAHMPELQKDAPSGLVHRLGDEPPALHLLLRPDARGVGITNPHGSHGGGLGEDEPCACTLPVVLGHEGVWHTLLPGPGTGERGEENTVRESQGAELEGIKESGHGDLFFSSQIPNNRMIELQVKLM